MQKKRQFSSDPRYAPAPKLRISLYSVENDIYLTVFHLNQATNISADNDVHNLKKLDA